MRRWARASGALAVASAAFLGLADCGRGRQQSSPPVFPGAPVVLISVDTLRSDRLPFYGYGKVETPALSGLRADSILFERAYTHVPLTLPAHVSIFTGLLPDRHGVHDNLGYKVDPKVPTLAELLKKGGYATGGAVSSVVMSGASGIGRGFDLWDDDIVPTRAHQAISRVQRPGGEAEASVERWLDGRKAPFFAFLHLYEPHAPYEPPEPYRSRYADPYDGEIASADEIVGRFLDFLKRKGLYDGALIVFLSDHGEALGEHGESEHGVFLYREVLQVPLLVKLPGGRGRGQSVPTPVPLSDVFATIGKAVDLAGFVAPSGTESVLDAAWGLQAGLPRPERRIYAESFFSRIHFGWSELRCLLDGRWHYIESPKPEFYDLVEDPAELRNLIDDKPGPFRAMRIEMEKLRTSFRPPGAVDPEAAKQLASLGYLSSGATAGDGPLDDPKDHIATVQLMKDALADFKEGTGRKAVELTGRLLAENPRMMDIWELRSLALTRLGRMDESLEALKKAQELAPPGSTHYLRAIASQCLERGLVDEAVKHAQAAKSLGDAAAGEILSRALLARGDLTGAESEARTFLAGKGSESRGLLLLARIQLKRGDLPGALALTDRAALSVAQGLPPAGLHLLRGDVLARLSRHGEAEAEFRKEIQLYPETLTSWESLIALLAAEGRSADVNATAESLVRSVSGVEPYLSVIRVLRVVGDESGARRWQREGLQRYPEEPRLRRRPGAA